MGVIVKVYFTCSIRGLGLLEGGEQGGGDITYPHKNINISLTIRNCETLHFSDKEVPSRESLFHPARRKAGARAAECQRISQVLNIYINN